MPPPQVEDIEVILKNWAWTAFQKSGKEARKKEYEDVKLDVKWHKVEFVSMKPEYINQERKPENDTKIVFNSTYENLTSAPQDNSFTTERTTVSTCSTIIEKGFSKGINVELKLAAPGEILEVTTGFGKEISLNKGSEETQERSLTWTANSSVKVKEKHRVTASLVVEEESFKADFTMKVRIHGKALVVLTDIKDNNSFLYCVEGDVCQILYDKLHKDGYLAKDGKYLYWPVSGKCEFSYGIKQHIKIEEEEIL